MRIGVNIHRWGGHLVNEVRRIAPDLIVTTCDRSERRAMREASGGARIVARYPLPLQLWQRIEELEATLLNWYEPSVDWAVQGFNELGRDEWWQQARVEAQLVRRLAARGVLYVAGNMAVGNCEPQEFPLIWEPTLRALNVHGGYFGIHAYTWHLHPDPRDPRNSYYAFRYLRWEAECVAQGVPVPRWLATESGADGWSNPIGYKGRLNDDEYARILIELQREFAADGVEQAAWCLDAWPPFSDVFTFTGTPVVDILAEYNRRQPRGNPHEKPRERERRMATLEERIKAEEQRNAWLVEWLWRFGNDPKFKDTDLGYHARRLAVACAGGDEKNLPQINPR